MYFKNFQVIDTHREIFGQNNKISKENLVIPECNSFDANLEVIIVYEISQIYLQGNLEWARILHDHFEYYLIFDFSISLFFLHCFIFSPTDRIAMLRI